MTITKVPTNKAFIRQVAELMCLNAGDSWVSDDGAQDQWSATALESILAVKAVLAQNRERAKAQEKARRKKASTCPGCFICSGRDR